jgi:hypothetical protein
MIIFFQEILMLLFLWLLKLIDGIMELFSAIAGAGTVSYQGRQVNILELLIGDSTVGTVFWCVMILAVGLTCLFAVAGLIKNMIANNRQVSSIMGKFFLALLGTLAMLAVVVLGVLISNAVLKLVSEVFQLSGDTKLSSALFNACVGGWKKGHSIAEFNTSVSVGRIFGSYSTTLGIWPKDWKGNGMIDPDSFMYLPALVGSAGLFIALVIACVNLTKRIYEIVLLYLVMPVSMSTMPLDDGARFKIWRETFITKIILAHGTVFSVNLFILLLPIITQMRITGASGFANSLFYIFMLVGGAVVIPAGQQLFAKLFGSGDDSGHGGGFLRSAFYGGRMAGAAAVGLAAKTLKGGARGVTKIAGGNGHKKDESEKFTEEKKGSLSDGGEGADGGKYSGGQPSAASADIKASTASTNDKSSAASAGNKTTSGSADGGKYSENPMSITSMNVKPAATSTDKKPLSNNAESGKYSENRASARITETKALSESRVGRKHYSNQYLPEDGHGKFSTASTDAKSAAVSADNTDGGGTV